MRVYYANQEEDGKHKIIQVWAEHLGINPPDEYLSNYSVFEFDEYHNRNLARLVFHYRNIDTDLPDNYYVDVDGKLRDESDDSLVAINPNPQKESHKLSQLYGLTHEQLDTYIDNQLASITDLSSARTIIGELIRKLAHLGLYLAKQSGLEDE